MSRKLPSHRGVTSTFLVTFLRRPGAVHSILQPAGCDELLGDHDDVVRLT